MVITSNGRVIFWEARLKQGKALDYRAYFEISHTTHVASIHDLKQMKISFEHKKQGFYYFCSRFEACVELTFFSFNHKDSGRSKFLRTFGANTYIAAIKTFMMGDVRGNKREEEKPLIVSITSDIRDKQGTEYQIENSEQPLDDIIILAENLMKELGSMKDAFMKASAYIPITRANMKYARMSESSIDAFRSVGPGNLLPYKRMCLN